MKNKSLISIRYAVSGILSATLLAIFTIFNPDLVGAQEPTVKEENSARLIVHLLSYLAQDYKEAVQQGKVVNDFEFNEQKEFAATALSTAQDLQLIKNNRPVLNKLKKLKQMIQQGTHEQQVVPLVRSLREEILLMAGLNQAPLHWPSLKRGKQLFQQNCTSCHGPSGRGDGPAGQGLEPAPSNFWDPDRMPTLSAFGAFNTIKLGVEGTGMAAFDQFKDEEIWDLSFYLLSLRHEERAQKIKSKKSEESGYRKDFEQLEQKIQLPQVAALNEGELRNLIRQQFKNMSEDKEQSYLALLRTHQEDGPSDGALNSLTEENENRLAKTIDKNLQLTLRELQLAKENFLQQQFKEALHHLLESYLNGIEPIEPFLSQQDPQRVLSLEKEMMTLREKMGQRIKALARSEAQEQQKSDKEILQLFAGLELMLEQIKKEFSAPQEEEHFWNPFVFSLGIVLREALEAMLIVMTLLGVCQAAGQKKAKGLIHLGWLSAVLFGGLCWIFSGKLIAMSGAQREIIESVSALLAVIILVYMGIWLHSKTETKKWQKYIHDKTYQALSSGNLFGLFVVSFLAVFREAIETVLFLRTLWNDQESTHTAISMGVASSLIIVMVLSGLYVRYSHRIPLRKLFSFSSFLMLALAVVLTGKGIRALQEVGLVSITSSSIIPDINFIGLYGTMETIFAQGFILIMSILLVYFSHKKNIAKRI